MPVVRAEIEIEAPAERIFDILTDLDAYPEWNPFTPQVESTLRPGDPVHLYVRLRGNRLSHRVEYVSAVERPFNLSWRTAIGARFLLSAERRQTLTPIDERRTRYVSEDVMHGVLAPLVMLTFGPAMRRGFESVATALKQRAEKSQ